ncbi:PREDICTED: dynein intermediate chain 2, axonemal-like [Polistes canadensis]|uniref:dynein intermediate chain 2, axonemal-like n=1 Tax=Polistes canadensis TaxID=91411 RepID=UPI000718C492|nr:PREDICTED: dynein intermediate chain 2, axonemal-like [Polistes canadensis]
MDLAHPERENINEATGVSALQYESTMGSGFLAGLENGIVVNVNRRAISKTEKLYTRFYCHLGSVLTIDRHPGSLKNFLTVGDNHAKVWTEGTKEHCLVKTGRKISSFLTGACWSRSRWSFFFTIDTIGMLDVYDLFEGTIVPYYGISICEKPLTTIKPHDDGKILAVGGSNGKVYLIACKGLCTTTFPNDKHFFASYLDRCSKYEKLAETRRKEIGLTIVSTPMSSMMESIPLKSKDQYKDKSKDRDRFKGKNTREKIKRQFKKQEKLKDIPRKSKPKKLSRRDSPFADDPEILEAEKHYFLTMTTVFE